MCKFLSINQTHPESRLMKLGGNISLCDNNEKPISCNFDQVHCLDKGNHKEKICPGVSRKSLSKSIQFAAFQARMSEWLCQTTEMNKLVCAAKESALLQVQESNRLRDINKLKASLLQNKVHREKNSYQSSFLSELVYIDIRYEGELKDEEEDNLEKKKVFVCFDQEGWQKKNSMKRNHDGSWQFGKYCIPNKRLEFKFLVDGVWKESEFYPTVDDSFGGKNNVITPAMIQWEDGGSEIYLYTDFDGWSKKYPLTYYNHLNKHILKIELGNIDCFQFKFVVDGEWKLEPKYPTIENSGHRNNFLRFV